MPVKFTPATLEKFERILEESGYILRYEKGNFTSGYCILEHRKVVVINKFLDTEGRITTLMDIIPALQVRDDALSPEARKMYAQILKEAAPERAGQAAPGETTETDEKEP